MSLVFSIVWVFIGCLFVCRAIDWLPVRFAEEESAIIADLLRRQDGRNWTETPILSSSITSFISCPPTFSFTSLCYVSGALLIAVWGYVIFGSSWNFFLWTAFGWVLVVLAVVDYQTQLLPDFLTLPMLWLGLVIQLLPETRTVGLEFSVVGAIGGYLPLWVLAHAYRLIRGRDGLGMGDLKLLAAMGAWSGPFVLPQVLLLAALLAIALFVIERVLRRSTAGIHEERPFGPAIVAAYFIVMTFAHSVSP
ncbi:MAG: prepilin peptidase [Polynucleobacter victoriensis]